MKNYYYIFLCIVVTHFFGMEKEPAANEQEMRDLLNVHYRLSIAQPPKAYQSDSNSYDCFLRYFEEADQTIVKTTEFYVYRQKYWEHVVGHALIDPDNGDEYYILQQKLINIGIPEEAFAFCQHYRNQKLLGDKSYKLRNYIQNFERQKEMAYCLRSNIVNAHEIFMLGVYEGLSNIVKLSFARGVNINMKDFGVTPLSLAIKEGHHDIVELLLKQGVEPALQDIPLMITYVSQKKNNKDELLKFLEYNVNLNAPIDLNNNTLAKYLLTWCLRSGDTIVLNKAIKKGANFTMQDKTIDARLNLVKGNPREKLADNIKTVLQFLVNYYSHDKKIMSIHTYLFCLHQLAECVTCKEVNDLSSHL